MLIVLPTVPVLSHSILMISNVFYATVAKLGQINHAKMLKITRNVNVSLHKTGMASNVSHAHNAKDGIRQKKVAKSTKIMRNVCAVHARGWWLTNAKMSKIMIYVDVVIKISVFNMWI